MRQTYQAGYSSKQSARVVTVDQNRRRVEVALKDGTMTYAAVWETPVLFRWPKTGEVWTIRRDQGIWRLDAMADDSVVANGAKNLKTLGEGQVRLISETGPEGSGTFIGNAQLQRGYSEIFGNGTSTAFTITHGLNTPNVNVTYCEEFVDAALTVAINETATTALISNTTSFPASGLLYLEDEIVTYTSKDATHIYGLLRGREGTVAAVHQIGALFNQPTELIEGSAYVVDNNRIRITFLEPPAVNQFRAIVSG